MDAQRFDAITKALAATSSRRSALGRLLGSALGGTVALAAIGRTRADSTCVAFCRQLPPGPLRGACVSDAQHGAGLCAACAGDPTRLCVAADGTATCCDPSLPCQDGHCSCYPSYSYCPQTGGCVDTYCNYRKTFSAAACQCVCEAPFVQLAVYGCAIPCTTSADCGLGGVCATSTEGQSVCYCGAVGCGTTFNIPCTSSTDCSASCGGLEDVICDAADHICKPVC